MTATNTRNLSNADFANHMRRERGDLPLSPYARELRQLEHAYGGGLDGIAVSLGVRRRVWPSGKPGETDVALRERLRGMFENMARQLESQTDAVARKFGETDAQFRRRLHEIVERRTA